MQKPGLFVRLCGRGDFLWRYTGILEQGDRHHVQKGVKKMEMMKKHQFWACVTLFAMVMTLITGHMMIGGSKEKED